MAGQQANAPDNSGYTHLGFEFFNKVAKNSLNFKVMLLIGSQNILRLKK